MGVPIIRTLAEIDATVRKAMRGHGYAWGLAEEAGKAARWLASYGLPAGQVMAELASSNDGFGSEPQTRTCPLTQATALADRALALAEPITMTAEQPLLILAQMGRAADALDRAFALKCEAFQANIARNSLTITGQGDLLAPTSHLICRPAIPIPGSPASPAACAVDACSWETLCMLAERILVPASDLSRAGAGTALSDND